MSKELTPLEALERIKNAPTIYVGCGSDIYTRYSFECNEIEKALKEYESRKTLLDNIDKDIVVFEPKEVWEEKKRKLKELEKENNKLRAKELDYYMEKQESEKKLKALEIIKKKPVVALVDYKYTYEEWLELVDERNKDLFKNKEEYDLLKEVLL